MVDKFGHCVKCGKNLITEKVIGMEVKKVLTIEYDQVKFKLEDGSNMKVVMCKTCQKLPDDTKEIMKTVVNGWKEEIKHLAHWDDKKKKDYMKVYGKKKIKHKVKEFKYGPNHKK